MGNVILDYGISNLGSIKNMIEYLGYSIEVTNDPKILKDAEKIILPGVGSFGYAMDKMNENRDLTETLNEEVLEKKKLFLGICLGMQLITIHSEESEQQGLGWIDAYTKKFPIRDKIKIPHVGWNYAQIATSSSLTHELSTPQKYYFTHSYYVEVTHEENSLMKTEHGIRFDSAIYLNNIFGVQFHPEKSHQFGLKILKNFMKI